MNEWNHPRLRVETTPGPDYTSYCSLPDLTILPIANAPSQTKAPVEPPTFSTIEEV